MIGEIKADNIKTTDPAAYPLRVEPESVRQEPWTREKVLADAKRCVCGERDQSYGGPEDSFRTIANLWTAYLTSACGEFVEFSPVDVSVMLGLLKVARIAANPQHMDSWVDLAGYAACGGEIAGGGTCKK